ncbi:MAG: rhamnulokinase [Lachnospiraceae bacterium]|nr:rhamnulokinase [Lachnospiraceae bacterium]
MGEQYFLAVDIGASSGRHILGYIKDGRLTLEEVYRFWNGMDEKDGTLSWDTERLFNEILAGMKKCREIGKIPASIGVDTWGVDFVLLDKNDKKIGEAVGYRDSRTDGMDEEVFKIVPEKELYARTGIQKAIYNTVYQLMALKKHHPEQLEAAETMLMMPDYFHYRLSGKKVQEYTEATTSQLVDPITRNWDYELVEKLGFPARMLQEIRMPGTNIGGLTEEVQKEVGFNCDVVLPPTHDTASAVMAVPTTEKNICYISSGTWSLMGVEKDEPDCSDQSRQKNFTNEGGYDGEITYLTNIMGLWMIQSVRNKLAPEKGYGEICEEASKEKITSLVDCQDDAFLAPDDMVKAIQDKCRETAQEIPETLPQLAAVVYNSLAKCYADKLKEIEQLTGRKYNRIHIIGGGSNAVWLNELSAKYAGVPVYAGPGEATALGNILSQMIGKKIFADLGEARSCVADSFEIRIYE